MSAFDAERAFARCYSLWAAATNFRRHHRAWDDKQRRRWFQAAA